VVRERPRRDLLLRLRLLGEKVRVDVRQDAAAGDGDGAQELVELLVVADGELDVARDESTPSPRAPRP
jgi:hypothetical protein